MRQSAVHFAIIRDEDNVTGAQVELSLLVNLPRPRLWELVTDVARYGEWSPECEYTGWLPVSFAWVVLDGSGEVNRPGSIWRYELSPGDQTDRTWLRHSFMHGPARRGFEKWPGRIRPRWRAVSLAAMLDGERYREAS